MTGGTDILEPVIIVSSFNLAPSSAEITPSAIAFSTIRPTFLKYAAGIFVCFFITTCLSGS